MNRREFINRATNGFAGLALADLLCRESQAAEAFAPRAPQYQPKAKAVIYLYMEGGPSHIDTFDPKPELKKLHGKPLPMETPNTVFNIGKTVMASPFQFQQHGESGAQVSSLFPHVAECVDDMTIIRSMHHGISNHSSACYISHTGYSMAGKPSMGAWLTYGLGSECDDLPGFVLLDCGMGPSGGAPSWGSGFLPAEFQGTLFLKGDNPVEYVKPQEATAEEQTGKLSLIRRLNRHRAEEVGTTSKIDALNASYETAFKMQSAVPELIDFSDESKATRNLYGMDDPQTGLFGSRCLMARRLVERGVRFVEVFPPRVRADRWDQHSNLKDGHVKNAGVTDRGVAGLLKDLKSRGMLEETIVLWGGEFGRTPNAQGKNGRDHNPFGYTVWAAGGGFKPGIRYGQTDDFGYYAQKDKVHLHDLHATILHLMGIEHTKLTYRFAGRDFRLTDVHGKVIDGLLA